jgi:pyruvate/2-oxoglutarate dehydrogenase complex dihydrolipoamide dehydrogenase (E3) component
MHVAVVERKRFGGTCVNNGCIPTKTLVASARAAHMARRAGDFGVLIPGAISVDMKRVKARKDGVVRISSSGVESWLRSMKNCTIYQGHARFETPTSVRVGDESLQADKIFVNVGGRARIPPLPGLDGIGHLTNTSMMEVDFLPGHLLVLGGSYVGLEFAQMYRRFGSQVTVIQRGPRLISRDDEDVSQAVREILENEGVRVCTDTADYRLESRAGGVVARLSCEGEPLELVGSHLLLALGRIPNTHDLGLHSAGVATDEDGYIVVDDQLRTNVSGIWAMGDCNGRGAFTHTSYNDFEIVAANLLDGDPRRVSDRIVTSGLFIDPPLARAGMTETEVRGSGHRALIAKMPMSRVGRAKERDETQGFMKVLVDAETERILGATLLGIGCDEVVHLILDVMYAGAPYTVIQRAMHIHPTVAELIPTLLGNLRPLE